MTKEVAKAPDQSILDALKQGSGKQKTQSCITLSRTLLLIIKW